MATNTRGVFTLTDIDDKISLNGWVSLEDVWIDYPSTPTPNTGYWAGGQPTPSQSSIDKLTYSSDTTAEVPGAALTDGRYGHAAVSSSAAGYFVGGAGGSGDKSSYDKCTYSSDTVVAVPSANLTTATYYTSGTGNSDAGYTCGGYSNGLSGYITIVDKLTYSTDTAARVPSGLSQKRSSLAAVGNSTAGYIGGGYHPPNVSTMDKLTYATDTTANLPGAPLSSIRNYPDATGNATVGYFAGGQDVGANYVTTVDKITYSSDTLAEVPGAGLTDPTGGPAATGNLSDGYFGGGYVPGAVTTMDKLTYSSDTTEKIPGAALASPRGNTAATSARANALPTTSTPPSTRFSDGLTEQYYRDGYFGGGFDNGNNHSTMDKITYSNDTLAAVPGAAISNECYGVGATGSSTAGYFGGGAPTRATMDKLSYASNTTAPVPGADLSVARNGVAATGNSTHGYFGGGGPGNRSTMDKCTYSSDTTAEIPGAALSFGRTYTAATGNSSAGYFGGGGIPGKRSTMDKCTYSTDTTAAVPGAFLTDPRYGVYATGNSSSGYFAAGRNTSVSPDYLSNTDKLTYASDTTAKVPSASLSGVRHSGGATGNSDAGYFAGGHDGTVGYISTIDKMTYSTDTSAAVPGLLLSTPRGYMGGASELANALPSAPIPQDVPRPSATPTPQTGVTWYTDTVLNVANNGYFAGGQNPGPIASIDKTNYSSDTTALSPTATLSRAVANMGATGNSTDGYIGGGYWTGSGSRSTMEKLNYASDTVAEVTGSPLTAGRYGVAATGTSSAGYFSGGINLALSPNYVSTTDKLTYASDTIAETPGAALTNSNAYHGATGNTTDGYFGGGYAPVIGAYVTIMDKLTYSSDTTARIPGADLITPRNGVSVTGNADGGYWGGGYNPSAYQSAREKCTYSTDTTAAGPAAFLSIPCGYFGATSSQTAGYFGGGAPLRSTMEKLTYSSDTIAEVPGAALSSPNYSHSATSPLANALPGSAQVQGSAPIIL